MVSRLFPLVFFCAVSAMHAQQNLSGRWKGSFDVPGPGGVTQHDTALLILQQDGDQVTGTAGRDETTQLPLYGGLFRDGTLIFAMDVRQTIVHFSLALVGDHLRGTATGLPPDPSVKVAVDVARQPTPTVDALLQHFMGNILIAREGQVLAEHSYGSANLE